MKVKIIETGKMEELQIVDDKTGCCFANEEIGNAGADNDGQFTKAFEDGLECDYYTCSQPTYDWWVEHFKELGKQQA